MMLSGFTFVRDAVKCEYPIVESISSILPIVDEFIVNVGLPDTDGTAELITSINNPKVRLIRSQWNPNLDIGCYVYTQQANIALFNCMGKWAFYLQADEVVHEDDHAIIMENVEKYVNDDRVDGLVLKQINFWGDFKTFLCVYPKLERRRAWIVKPHRFVLCAKDASRFTVHPKFKEKGRLLRAVETDARLFHYHGIKSQKGLEEKYETVRQYWQEEKIPDKEVDFYRYYPRQFVSEYTGSHPKVMAELIKKHKISLDLTSSQWRMELTAKEKKQWRMHKIMHYLPEKYFLKRRYEKVAG
jgi:glycosyltransferase involved in cell wall biosynthesis